MNTFKKIYLTLIVACILTLLPSFTKAETNFFVFDGAQILSNQNLMRLQEQANAIYNEHNVAVYTVIVDFMPVKDDNKIDDFVFEYTSKFKDNMSISDNMVILFICVEKNNRWREALAFGEIHHKLTGSRLRAIQDEITPNLTAGKYYTAISTYYTMTAEYIVAPKKFNYIAHSIIVIIACTIAFFVVRHLIKTAGGVVTVCHKTYSANSARVTNKGDIYTHTTTTKTKVKSSSSGGGGGGSRRGGGGRF